MRRKKQSFITNKLLFKIEMLLFWDSPKYDNKFIILYIISYNIVIYCYK